MATAKRRSTKAPKLVRDSDPAKAEIPAPKVKRKLLPSGNHVAPFRSRAGNPVLLTIMRGDFGSQLFSMGEVTEMRGHSFWGTPRGMREDDHWRYIPRDEHLLPRGVHRAPWRLAAGMSRREGLIEVFLAIDSDHCLVEMLTVWPHDDGSPDVRGEEEAQRFLEALLDSHEATQAEVEATRDPNEPAPVLDPWGFNRFKSVAPERLRRGIWSRHNREYYFVDSNKKHIATLEFHDHYEQVASPFDLTNTLRKLMNRLDPIDESDDEDDDLPGDEWKRA
jgi:hypothetical protein